MNAFLLYYFCVQTKPQARPSGSLAGGEGMILTRIKGEQGLLIPAWERANPFTVPTQDLKKVFIIFGDYLGL